MSSTESDTDSVKCGQSAPKKAKWRKQKFNRDWLQLEQFKGWLKEVPQNPYSCRCVAYDCQLTYGKSELQKHSKGKKHLQKVKLSSSNTNMHSFFKPIVTRNEDRQVQDFEIRLSAFFAEHNVALQIIDHFVPLLQEIIPDSKIIQKVALGRKKCTSIIKNVLAPTVNEDLLEILKMNKFAVLVDESTDIGLHKTMCVLVRYLDPSSGEVKTKLLQLSMSMAQ